MMQRPFLWKLVADPKFDPIICESVRNNVQTAVVSKQEWERKMIVRIYRVATELELIVIYQTD